MTPRNDVGDAHGDNDTYTKRNITIIAAASLFASALSLIIVRVCRKAYT